MFMRKIVNKSVLLIAFLFAGGGFARAQTTLKATPEQPLNVAFWVFPGVVNLDLTGPMEVFIKANRMTRGAYRLYTVAVADTLLPTERSGLRIKPDFTVDNAPAPDILVVPGMPNSMTQPVLTDQSLLNGLRALAGRSKSLLSICTGALLLGQIQALDGRRVTTHWAVVDSLARRFPKASAVRQVRYVQDGNLTTTAGVTAGIDGALRLVEQYSGTAVAQMVTRAMEYSPQPPFSADRLGANRPKMAYRGRPVLSAPKSTGALKAPVKAGPGGIIVNSTDPVCQMRVAATTTHRHTHQGKTYGFCSAGCRAVFAANPLTYAK